MVSVETLRALLSYDPETGKLFWKHRSLEWFKTTASFKQWNTRFADKEAFTSIDGAGYLHGTILGKTYYKHRVCYAIFHGVWVDEVDHDNGVKTNNEIVNLNGTNHQDNMRNVKLREDNKSGRHGIFWEADRNKWKAQITLNGKTIFLGRYIEIDDAIAAREKAEKDLTFNPNHGMR